MSNPDSTKNYFGGTPQVNQWGEYYSFAGAGCALPTEYDLQTQPPVPAFQWSSGVSATQTFLHRFQPPL